MQPKSAEILERLIRFDTTSYKSNLELIDYIRQLLASHQVDTELVYDQTGRKANLYATIGPACKPISNTAQFTGVMLSGHTDVVPVEGQDWSSDPFSLTTRDGRYFGRGTADMKGFIASVLAAVPAMCAAELSTPIHIALSYDEEVGCLGVRRLIDMLAGQPVQPSLVIVGEPTSMKPVSGHKGKNAFTVSLQGKAGHSAYTGDAVNAIEYAARLISYINEQHRLRAQQGPFDPGYRVPHTTLHVGTIKGGTGLNIVPAACDFAFEIRNIPADDPAYLIEQIQLKAAQLQRQMRETCPDAAIKIHRTASYPGLHTDPQHPALQFVQSLLSRIGQPNNAPGKVSFGTEGGLFTQMLGITTVVCGPGDIAQAHKPDEFLDTMQLRLCDEFIEQLINHCQQPVSV